ncbi:MAG: hypothetical protein JNN08_17200 [Bryobacterales bacterium]|nr:hypothetical protein [Bryobacterales bacterium]
MKRHLACAVCLIILSVLPASAQFTRQLTADIPFGFYAGDKWLAAGEYKFLVNDNVVTVQSPEQPEALLFARHSANGDKNSAPSITFTKYSNDRIFLARLYNPAWSVTPDLVKSKREREVVSSRVVCRNRLETVVILARLSR